MDFAIKTRQLARVFVDAQSIMLDAGVAVDLLGKAALSEKLGGTVLVPTPILDISQPPGAQGRWGLVSPKLDWQIALLGTGFDMVRIPTDVQGTNLGEFADFAQRAARVLWACADYFGRMPYRVSLLQNGMLGELPPGEDAVARRLLQLPPSFERPGPFEWDWRCAKHGRIRLGSQEEETNVVATLKRGAGVITIGNERLAFDRIQVELDVNTSPADTRGRFHEQEVREFFAGATQEHARLSADLAAFALGDS